MTAGTKSDAIGHYRIKQKLGSGGMGEVYLAEDTKLHRDVALKVMPLDVADDPQRRSRFLQEAHAASSLNHPNVSTIYEVGESDGTIFIAMEYIDGRTLSQVRESRTIEIDEVLDIALQVSDALDEAHARGIVHRDIKSANIMLTARGHAKMLDFGLAKLLAPGPSEDEETKVKSTPGLVVGTSYYMSPEQALGRPVDQRSDLFSLGVLLYELVTGKLPFKGGSTTETIEKITHSQPDPIARFNYSVPPEMERIIRKLLEKDPARRYQSAREVHVDLKNLKRDTSSGEVAPGPKRVQRKRFLLIVATAVVLAVLIGTLAYRQFGQGARTTAKPAPIDSIAVMPFVNASKDPESEYLSDGIAESIINNLTSISALRVIPRSTVFRYKGKDVELQQIARELDVRAIVSGRVLQRGDTLSVQTELIDMTSNAQIWGARYERKVSDALAVQEEISSEISRRLRPSADPAASRQEALTSDGEAYELYLKGRYHWNKRTAESLKKALGFFEQAAAKDPQFALAHVGIADSYLLLEQYADRPSPDVTEKAEAAVRKAIAIDDEIAEAHTTLAFVHMNRWEWDESEAEFKRAIALNPNYPTTRHWYNIMLRYNGRTEEAFVQVRKAQELDPLSMIIGVNVVDVLMLLERFDEALATGEKYMEIDPNFPQLLGAMSELYSRMGRHTEAIAAARKAVELSGGVAEQTAVLAIAHARAGNRDEAQKIVAGLEQRASQGEGNPYFLALAYAELGDRDRAFTMLSRAIERGSGMVGAMRSEDSLEDLRSDPRFAALLRRVRLPV